MRRALTVYGLLVAICAASAIAGCKTPERQYVEADRLTFEAVAPEYLSYTATDPGLSAAEKDRARRTVETWRLRLSKAGAAP